MVIHGTAFELLSQAFYFYAEFFKDAFGWENFSLSMIFLSRNLCMADDSFKYGYEIIFA